MASALDAGEWSASCPGRFTPDERTLGALWIEGWVGPSVILDSVECRQNFAPTGNQILAAQSVARRYTY
jgi:hypothetical protein